METVQLIYSTSIYDGDKEVVAVAATKEMAEEWIDEAKMLDEEQELEFVYTIQTRELVK